MLPNMKFQSNKCGPTRTLYFYTYIADFFRCVSLAQSLAEHVTESSSSTVSIQDGPNAGQTVRIFVLQQKAIQGLYTWFISRSTTSTAMFWHAGQEILNTTMKFMTSWGLMIMGLTLPRAWGHQHKCKKKQPSYEKKLERFYREISSL